jgi:tripartite-type tricarboxylate transporter receptor subunit TctC
MKTTFAFGRPTLRATLAAIATLLAAIVTPAAAQAPGRVIVPYPPGGSLNAMARLVADRLSESAGRTFVVENRGGAAGAIGSAALKGGPTDGSLLLFAPDSNISVYPPTVTKPAYVPLTDFVAIAHSGDYRIALAVHPSVPANDLKSFVAWTRAQPGAVGYGTAGAGTNLHFYGVLFAQTTGANLVHVPYKGTGPAVVDLLAGHVPATVLPLGGLLANYKAGKIRILAQTGEGRSASLADVPSFREAGVPQLAVSGWYGVFAPAGTPADIVNRYNDIIVKALRTPELRERMRGFELEPREMSAAEFQAFVKADTERWAPIIKASGFTPSAD